MATIIYLWDGGNNTDGSSWTNAYTTYAAAAADWSTSDEIIYMAQDHQETGAPLTLSGATGDSATDRVRIYSMERTGTTYAPQTSNYNFQSTGAGGALLTSDCIDAHGVYFETADGNIDFTNGSSLTDCTLSVTAPTSAFRNLINNDQAIHCQSCTFNVGGSNNYGRIADGSGCLFLDCLFTGRIYGTNPMPDAYASVWIGGKLDVTSNPSSLAEEPSENGMFAHLEWSGFSSDDDVIAGNVNYPNRSGFISGADAAGVGEGQDFLIRGGGYAGSVSTVTGIYRDDGWVDTPSGNNLSWKIAPDSATCTHEGAWLKSPRIMSRLDSTGSKTFTAYGVHDYASININDIAMHVLYQGTANSTRWHLASTQGDPEATTALTSDTSDWTGASGKTKFKLAKTVTVNTTGEWMVYFVAKHYESGKAIWICPKVEIT